MKFAEINIGGYRVSTQNRPMIVAELSGNHNQSLERALELVDLAADSGADAIKLQTYTADTMTIASSKDDFMINDSASLWHGYNLHELYQVAYTPWEWHEALFKRCSERGVICFSTPFDSTAVDFLEGFDVPCHKIASFENTDHQLLKKVASTGKPIIMSNGMASLAELVKSVEVLRENGCDQLVLLQCTSAYPAQATDANLTTMRHMSETLQCHVGLSDHTLSPSVAIAATALGACMVEKHFTKARADGGVDSAFSLEPAELRELVEQTTIAFQSLGTPSYGPSNSEKASLKYRRSLYVVEDVKAGEELTSENVRAIRPGYGLPTGYVDIVLGRKATKNIERGTPVSFDLLLGN